MSLDPRPFLVRALTAIAAVVLLVAGPLACTPGPEEVDESPVAGMTGENPSDDEVLGDAITAEEAGVASLTLSGTPAVEGAAEVQCSVIQTPEHHDAAGGHGEEAHGEETHASTDSPDNHGESSDADYDEGHAEDSADDGHGDGHGDSEGDHGGGHGSFTKTATLALTPPADSGVRLVVQIAGYHGEGQYDADFRLEAMDSNGAYVESTGSGTVNLEIGTLLSSDAATHWIGGDFEGQYEGDAGSGQATGRVERCYYFH